LGLTPSRAARHARQNPVEEEAMSVRLVISMDAAPGKGGELLKAMEARCALSRADKGCLQFEVFQSGNNPDRLALLELWESAEDLAEHAKLQAQRPPLPEGLRLGGGEREDYTYNRTR
jgi:quinol monooxygenase YgiN